MTHRESPFQKRVNLAMQILGEGARRREVERTLLLETAFIERLKNYKQSGWYGVQTKDQKEAADRFEMALRKLDTAIKGLKGVGLHHSLLADFPIDEIDIKRWRNRAKEAVDAKLPQPKPIDRAKRRAAEAAARLLLKYGHPLGLGRKGKFCRLAAVFYGDLGAEFLHHCRAVRADRNRVRNTPG